MVHELLTWLELSFFWVGAVLWISFVVWLFFKDPTRKLQKLSDFERNSGDW